MDAIEAIKTRRSIRRFKDKEVSEAELKELLAAAMQAPSAVNEQPWQFVVIRDRAILEKIPSIHIYASMAKEASAAILVCADMNLEKSKGFWVLDCSAAVENLLLAAHAKGLGAVWCGIYPNEERMVPFSEMFSLPTNVIPFALVPIGYPDEKKAPEDRFRPDRVHKDKW
jgi:nitroreductase